MNKDIAIKIENVSKQYRLGVVGTGTLSHDLKRWWTVNVRGKEDPYLKIGETNDRTTKGSSDYVWALKDINLEIERGDVVGIIGKNGAGKSTLLKILSRVTKPTTGTIQYNGRIASLLEVGTGFHPEMTGRENIYMNGAIMGMTRTEITRKLDGIIDFAGVERYIDTPVKRYSSGMTVRLGFSIAAHLEPDILVVDEVLAVGDAEFQKKCLGKMNDVAGQGRTVLFVSHNINAIKQICKLIVIISNGKTQYIGDVKQGINNYLNKSLSKINKKIELFTLPRERSQNMLIFDSISFDKEEYSPNDNIIISLRLKSLINTIAYQKLIISCIVSDFEDTEIYHMSSIFLENRNIIHSNDNCIYEFTIVKNSLTSGRYYINLWLSANNKEMEYIRNVGNFYILEGNIYNSTYPISFGIVQPNFNFLIGENVASS